ncbi:hypothetical protein HMP0015_2236 [Acinetobacter haemolyticus ATCC 19194]|uniref:Uncharacterized protein n=1 Tax=Acinetobacter haemolyticus ATCC 19194 TaxID=707232 RepID=D4XR94_ACIHA|nr:hypothetical protein HMPREF0023_1914 [Acinetobacter sp. ATCC 27244]EFF82313.1 hypothetical protein HMP0015_2236 [Acinetobacter haemolyticus ATCC 19194]
MSLLRINHKSLFPCQKINNKTSSLVNLEYPYPIVKNNLHDYIAL